VCGEKESTPNESASDATFGGESKKGSVLVGGSRACRVRKKCYKVGSTGPSDLAARLHHQIDAALDPSLDPTWTLPLESQAQQENHKQGLRTRQRISPGLN